MMTPVETIVERGRAAQKIYEQYTQAQVNLVVEAVAWSILEPKRNQELAELAVTDTGLGDVADKFKKNFRKTLGLVRDLSYAKTVGIISEDLKTGLTEYARPVGVVGAITPSTNPGATPINKILNALKCRNAVIIAPSPKGQSTCARLLEFVHHQLDQVKAPRDLVQMLPSPITKDSTNELMRLVDLVVATGSQSNIRAAYTCGTPAFGVGAGNVLVIIDEYADLASAANKILQSKTFDNATSCSSENGAIICAQIYDQAIGALEAAGGLMLDATDKKRLEDVMFQNGKLTSTLTAQSPAIIAERAQLQNPKAKSAKFFMVEEQGYGPDAPFSGEKLSPVLTVWKAADFEAAKQLIANVYAYQGAGHSVGLHTAQSGDIQEARAAALAQQLPVARIIVNQAHAIATGGSFENGLPFSLSMGCGTWGKNNFSENMNYRHYMNITRVVRPIPEHVPKVEDLLKEYFSRFPQI
ncbi:aldehyde dehydrogenase family protein [Polynucleobacter sp. AP-Kaivos-20-H2]|uniref:acylating sulfoacetaldehyde dehydrogenase n=1 Tax=Polynucleobacter sp. AP-Kaivos-20-H2 TaxID=2689104 RepID=UPI001C0DFE05|nr:aldehyde dehydrogenase family protein [Polynucleobacter sp. AP-Kaivos-20-H2]MBU3603894.1 aldehyde dehydrogenase family protein [Polynucleobacter sp. AP-Kaivos-20-H2]